MVDTCPFSGPKRSDHSPFIKRTYRTVQDCNRPVVGSKLDGRNNRLRAVIDSWWLELILWVCHNNESSLTVNFMRSACCTRKAAPIGAKTKQTIHSIIGVLRIWVQRWSTVVVLDLHVLYQIILLYQSNWWNKTGSESPPPSTNTNPCRDRQAHLLWKNEIRSSHRNAFKLPLQITLCVICSRYQSHQRWRPSSLGQRRRIVLQFHPRHRSHHRLLHLVTFRRPVTTTGRVHLHGTSSTMNKNRSVPVWCTASQLHCTTP